MGFPGFQEYEQALLLLKYGKTPFRKEIAQNFAGASVEKGPLATHHASGQFAIVYKLRSSGTSWALRCPKSAFPTDIVERCQRISDTRSKNGRTYLLNTSYTDRGMFAGNQEVPVMLMEWAEGEDLRKAVEKSAQKQDRQRLGLLADRFEELERVMDQDGFAHGDLSHGNVMVRKDDSMVLVDYDTAFRAGDQANRRVLIGTPGYVHPQPTDSMMQESIEMDRIPRKIIRLALRAFAAEPALFGRFSKENLLFDLEDLESPSSSRAFSELGRSVPALRSDLDEIASLVMAGRSSAGTSRPNHASYSSSTYQPGETVLRGSLIAPSSLPYEPGESVSAASSLQTPKVAYIPGGSGL